MPQLLHPRRARSMAPTGRSLSAARTPARAGTTRWQRFVQRPRPGRAAYNGDRSLGDWCIGNTAVSKTATPGSIPGSPALLVRRTGCGYTFGMKTAVSIPDDLFRKADELASRMGKSRSEVYREALADYVSRRDPGAITGALDEIADELSAEERALTTAAARRTLAQSEW